jgi:O-antigen/teichoic acid export membrane protein
MKSHITNSAFGALDYLAYPIGMLLLAPAVLHVLGVERYGIWALAGATLNTGAILASGFGDANVRAVAVALAKDNRGELLGVVRNSLGIHIVLGLVFTMIGWLIAPAISRLTAATNGDLYRDCLWSLRIASLLTVIRAVETVCVSTQRAFSRYGAAIQFSLAARLLSLAAAALMPIFVPRVSAVMMFTLGVSVVSLWLQMSALNRLLGRKFITPEIKSDRARALLRFGGYTWVQSTAALVFGQFDRIYVGMALGAAAVTPYVFCVQLTQPIYGVTAAGLHFLFPYLASHAEGNSWNRVRHSVVMAATLNGAFVATVLVLMIVFGSRLLRVWGGAAIAAVGGPLLPTIAWTAALPAFAVAGTYAMFAIGIPRPVAVLHIAGGLAMIAALPILSPRLGLAGIAYSRLAYGLAVMAVYLPLYFNLRRKADPIALQTPVSVCEET